MTKIAPGPHTVKGIDVSHYQPHINWSQVKKAGVEFAFIKATEGESKVDSHFASHWALAGVAGVKRGAYHFFHPSKSPTAQARSFVNTLGKLGPNDLPPVMDWESTDGVSNLLDVGNGAKFLQLVHDLTGVRPIIYSGPYFLNHLRLDRSFNVYPLWVAHYGTSAPLVPDPWTKWAFWQHSDHGITPGLQSPCDVNLFNGTLEELNGFKS